MFTDHTYYGTPIEVTRVELYAHPYVSKEELEFAKEQQIERLRHHAKRMPHKYWQDGELTGYEVPE